VVIHLYSGETRLRTIYNVIKVTQDMKHVLIVVNRVEGVITTNTFHFNKQYNHLIITVD